MAVTFVGFLTGFVAVLCIGNYFRAKRAQERQRQQRLARLAGSSGLIDSPRSLYSGSQSTEGEHQHLLSGGIRGERRRTAHVSEEDDLLLQVNDSRSMQV